MIFYDPIFGMLACLSIGAAFVYYSWGDRQFAAEFAMYSWIGFWVMVARYLWLLTPPGQQLADRLMARGPVKMNNGWKFWHFTRKSYKVKEE